MAVEPDTLAQGVLRLQVTSLKLPYTSTDPNLLREGMFATHSHERIALEPPDGDHERVRGLALFHRWVSHFRAPGRGCCCPPDSRRRTPALTAYTELF